MSKEAKASRHRGGAVSRAPAKRSGISGLRLLSQSLRGRESTEPRSMNYVLVTHSQSYFHRQ
eukprot:3567715-Prymnesium_polylepis.1